MVPIPKTGLRGDCDLVKSNGARPNVDFYRSKRGGASGFRSAVELSRIPVIESTPPEAWSALLRASSAFFEFACSGVARKLGFASFAMAAAELQPHDDAPLWKVEEVWHYRLLLPAEGKHLF